jgi:transposase InsO family protein
MIFRLVRELAADGVSVAVACRVLKVARSGYYERAERPPSQRAVADAALTATITEVHAMSVGSSSTPRTGCGAPTSPSPPAGGKVYSCAVLDVFSRRVVGWSIADHVRAELVARRHGEPGRGVVDALQMATWRRRPSQAPSCTPTADRSTPRGPSATGYAKPA